MLPDHAPRAPREGALRVVRDILARGDDDMPDALEHLGLDLAEPARLDRLRAGRHPGPVAFRLMPARGDGIRIRVVLQMEMEQPMLARERCHAVPQRRIIGDRQPRVLRDVDHAVVRGHDHPGAPAERSDELADRRIDALERVDPVAGLPPLTMPCHVEFGEVAVADPPPGPIRERLGRSPHSVIDRDPGDVPRSAEHLAGEPRVAVAGRAECEGRQPGRDRLGEERGTPQPAGRERAIVVALELVHDDTARGHEAGIRDDAVLSRPRAGREARERSRGRRGDTRVEHVSPRPHRRRERPRMTRASLQVVRTEAVDEDDERPIHHRESQPAGLAADRREAIAHHVGKAHGASADRR